VESYGTGTQVRLPGKSAMEPRIFKFGTPYSEMYRSLAATPEDEAFFLHNGVLQLCKRGSSVKVRSINFLICYTVSGKDIAAVLFRQQGLTEPFISNRTALHDSLLPSDGKTHRPKMYRSTTS
jgi:hypothetical protein